MDQSDSRSTKKKEYNQKYKSKKKVKGEDDGLGDFDGKSETMN